MKPIVQISLDLIDLDEALKTAEIAMRAGVDWLEAGTPLLLAEGVLRAWMFPDQLAFVQTSVCVTELAADAAPGPPSPPTAVAPPGASASVAPYPLEPSSLRAWHAPAS